jgi:hypothetical protein
VCLELGVSPGTTRLHRPQRASPRRNPLSSRAERNLGSARRGGAAPCAHLFVAICCEGVDGLHLRETRLTQPVGMQYVGAPAGCSPADPEVRRLDAAGPKVRLRKLAPQRPKLVLRAIGIALSYPEGFTPVQIAWHSSEPYRSREPTTCLLPMNPSLQPTEDRQDESEEDPSRR